MAGDIILLYIHEYHKWRLYDKWFLKYKVWQTEIFALSAPWQPGKSKLWKNKKTPGDTIILHICTINDNHMMYGSWDMKHDGQNCFSFWTIFCPFIPLTTQKSKFWKNEKNTWRYYHFTHLHHKRQSHDARFLR